MNPYKVLGVGRKVQLPGLKKAFRALSTQHHPDKGGDAEKFKEINTAYQILKNPERRKLYDETGQTSQNKVKTVQERAHDLLASLFESSLKQGVAFDKSQPLMDIMRSSVKENLSKAREAREGLRGGTAALKGLLTRITRDDDQDNVFEKLTKMHIRDNEEKQAKCERDIEAMEYLLEELKHYKSFDEVVRVVRVFSSNFSTPTGTGNTTWR